MALEDVYNMDDFGLFYRSQPNKTQVQGKVHECKIKKDHLTPALAVNMTNTDKLKLVINYKSLHPRCFGRWLPTYYVRWFANQTTWMTSDVFESWMVSLNVQFKSQKSKMLLFMDKYVTRSLVHVGSRGGSFGFQPCSWGILLLRSYHLMLQVWTILGLGINCFIQSSI